jgi:hypothetical protein
MLNKDAQLENIRQILAGKILVEALKTKVNRHKVFWIGCSTVDPKTVRVGIEFSNGNKYFYDWQGIKGSKCFGFELISPSEADDLEKKILEKRKKGQPNGSRPKRSD